MKRDVYKFFGTFINGEEYSGIVTSKKALMRELQNISENFCARMPHKIMFCGIDVTAEFIEF